MSITISGFGNTPLELALINQDGYASEYRYRDSSTIVSAFVRHQKTNKRNKDGAAIERHNIEVTVKDHSTPTSPEMIYRCYAVIEVPENGDPSRTSAACDAIAGMLSDNATVLRLLNWQPG